ncbi:MAG: response regulator transcription factor [Deltaproteobacteria bacterium]|nr:response regulator transcription factor [Deltaproteobacteria bacterium]
MSVTIALADDHAVVRIGVQALLQGEPDFTVIGEAADGLQALALAERLHPDVLVLDVAMSGLNGLEVTRQLAQRAPRTRVVILSMYADESYVAAAFQNGAAGYVLKGAEPAELIRAIHEAAAGRRYLGAPLCAAPGMMRGQHPQRSVLDPYETLTTREREVLQLAAEGHTSAEIAARLYVSARTVETHRANLMRKLGLHGQADLVRYALRRGIVRL